MSGSPVQFGVRDPDATYVPRRGGYAVVVNDHGEVAVVRTPAGVFLPGGGVEPGETAEAAAVRETFEECGLRIRIVACIGRADEFVFSRAEATHFQKQCEFFRAVLDGEEGTGERDHVLSWVPAPRAFAGLTHGSQRWAAINGTGTFIVDPPLAS